MRNNFSRRFNAFGLMISLLTGAVTDSTTDSKGDSSSSDKKDAPPKLKKLGEDKP